MLLFYRTYWYRADIPDENNNEFLDPRVVQRQEREAREIRQEADSLRRLNEYRTIHDRMVVESDIREVEKQRRHAANEEMHREQARLRDLIRPTDSGDPTRGFRGIFENMRREQRAKSEAEKEKK